MKRIFKYTLFLLLPLVFAGCAQNPQEQLKSANALFEAGNTAAAEQAYLDIISIDPSNAAATFGLASCSARQLAWADSYSYTLRAISLDPQNNDYAAHALNLEIEAKRWRLAEVRFPTVSFQSDTEKLISHSKILLGLGKPRMALMLLEEQTDEHPELLPMAALAAYASGDIQRAAGLLELAENQGISTRELGLTHFLLSGELTTLRSWIGQNPEDGDLVLILAESLIRNNDPQQAIGVIEASAEQRYHRADIALLYLEALSLVQSKEAIEQFVQALPARSAIWFASIEYGKGLVALLNKDTHKAINHLRSASTVIGSRSRLNLTLGLLAFDSGDLETARDQLLKGVRRYPSNSVAQLALAQSLWLMDDTERAELHLEAARRVNPENSVISELDAFIAARQKNYTKASTLLQKARTQGEISDVGKVLSARLALTGNRFDQAELEFSELLEAGSREIGVIEGYIELLLKTGRINEALEFTSEADDALLLRFHRLLLLKSGRGHEVIIQLAGTLTNNSPDTMLLAAAYFQTKQQQQLTEIAVASADFAVLAATASYLALLGNYEAALAAFEKAHAINAQVPAIMNGIAYCNLQLGLDKAYPESINLARRAFLSEPDNHHYQDTFNQLKNQLEGISI